MKRDRTHMARLDVDTPIEQQSWLVLVLFVALGFVPWMIQCFAEVCDESMGELDRRRGKL